MPFKLHLRDSESSWHTMDGTEEPDESITHVRVWGAGWVTTGSTRKPTPGDRRGRIKGLWPARLSLIVTATRGCGFVLLNVTGT
jgi:hypothetical protein